MSYYRDITWMLLFSTFSKSILKCLICHFHRLYMQMIHTFVRNTPSYMLLHDITLYYRRIEPISSLISAYFTVQDLSTKHYYYLILHTSQILISLIHLIHNIHLRYVACTPILCPDHCGRARVSTSTRTCICTSYSCSKVTGAHYI